MLIFIIFFFFLLYLKNVKILHDSKDNLNLTFKNKEHEQAQEPKSLMV